MRTHLSTFIMIGRATGACTKAQSLRRQSNSCPHSQLHFARGLFYVKYELQGKLGEGAFGEARLARRRKVMLPSGSGSCRTETNHVEDQIALQHRGAGVPSCSLLLFRTAPLWVLQPRRCWSPWCGTTNYTQFWAWSQMH